MLDSVYGNGSDLFVVCALLSGDEKDSGEIPLLRSEIIILYSCKNNLLGRNRIKLALFERCEDFNGHCQGR